MSSDLYRYDKPIDIYELLGRGEDSGKLLRLRTVKITYKYKQQYEHVAQLWIFGTKHTTSRPVMLCHGEELTDIDCKGAEVTKIIDINVKDMVIDMWGTISHCESLQELVDIKSVFEVSEIPIGITATAFDPLEPEVRVSIGDDFSSDIGSTADYTEDTTKIQLS